MISMGDKLYIITRQDISPGYQAVQSIHAAREFASIHPEIEREWFEQSNFLALLSVKDENELHRIKRLAIEMGIAHAFFEEEDVSGEMTALVLEPGRRSQELCRGLPLALNKPILKDLEWHLEADETGF
jgi:peptidyl-tRNA hydrolase